MLLAQRCHILSTTSATFEWFIYVYLVALCIVELLLEEVVCDMLVRTSSIFSTPPKKKPQIENLTPQNHIKRKCVCIYIHTFIVMPPYGIADSHCHGMAHVSLPLVPLPPPYHSIPALIFRRQTHHNRSQTEGTQNTHIAHTKYNSYPRPPSHSTHAAHKTPHTPNTHNLTHDTDSQLCRHALSRLFMPCHTAFHSLTPAPR